MQRWLDQPSALSRIGANAAVRGLDLPETLDELARGIASGAVPERLNQFGVARAVVAGWVDAQRADRDPATASSGCASAAYLRARIHETYGSRLGNATALIVVQSDRFGSPRDALAISRVVEGRVVGEHGPGVHLVLCERSAAAAVAARITHASRHARVWVEALPNRRGDVDRVLAELRASCSAPRPHELGAVSPAAIASTARATAASWRRHPALVAVPDALTDQLLAIVEHAASPREGAAAIERYGSSRRQSGATCFEALAEIGAISVGVPQLDVVASAGSLCRAWAGAAASDEAAAGMHDAITGLPNRVYLRRRIGEFRATPDRDLALVYVRIRQHRTMAQLTALAATSDFLRVALSNAETLGVVSPTTFTAVTRKREIVRLRDRCAQRPDVRMIRSFRLVPNGVAMGA